MNLISDTVETRIEHRNGLVIEWDVPIPMRDGSVLICDVYRPEGDGRHPVLMSHGPYAKGLSFAEGYPAQWSMLTRDHPEVAQGTTTEFANWETADPERWVPYGYVCVRVDSRGSGMSPGYVDPFSAQETQDYYDCIEWAAQQSWSTGKIGLAGVSYYAMNQWQVAAQKPPHLAAICPFEGASDYYRDAVRHGGIMSTFFVRWYPMQVTNAQFGLGSKGRRNPVTGRSIAGEVDLTDEERAANRTNIRSDYLAHDLITDQFFKDRVAALEEIEVPVLSCGNWGGQGLHLRGNVEGYTRAGSQQKWLELHGLEHWTEFYTDYGVALQKQFFDHFLKGEDNGWDSRPPVLLQVRHINKFVEREESEWPLARTDWTKYYLDTTRMALTTTAPAEAQEVSFRAKEQVLTFRSAPLEAETEITGPMMAHLVASSTTTDADLFVSVRVFDPEDKEVLFVGAVDPNAPISLGWLRASHRKLDPARSEPYRPVHAHDEVQPLVPGEFYDLDVEIWPSSIVVPKGYVIALSIGGKDYDNGLPEPMPQIYGVSQRGCSVFLHDDEKDRPDGTFDGTTTLRTGDAYVMLPVIPAK